MYSVFSSPRPGVSLSRGATLGDGPWAAATHAVRARARLRAILMPVRRVQRRRASQPCQRDCCNKRSRLAGALPVLSMRVGVKATIPRRLAARFPSPCLQRSC
jgi:hypothetical protein